MNTTSTSLGDAAEKQPLRPTDHSLQANVASSSRYAQFLGWLAAAEPLAAVTKRLEPLASRLTAHPGVRGFFRGDATGIPLHGILTDGPFGAWWSAIFLDFYKDDASRRAAKRLVAVGLIAAIPTAISGWAQWSMKDQATKRVGIVHAAINAAATLVYLASWAARQRGHNELGIGLARAGAVLLLGSGFLGGHLRSGRPRRAAMLSPKEASTMTPDSD